LRRVAPVARLYSIAVVPELAGRGLGLALLAAAEDAAAARGCTALRLEVHVANAPAIGRYQKSGFRLIGRRARYYEDGGDALRFEKRLPLAPARSISPSAGGRQSSVRGLGAARYPQPSDST
jgi:[ribosomal protein S18]-alanine N-acetyltransferase